MARRALWSGLNRYVHRVLLSILQRSVSNSCEQLASAQLEQVTTVTSMENLIQQPKTVRLDSSSLENQFVGQDHQDMMTSPVLDTVTADEFANGLELSQRHAAALTGPFVVDVPPPPYEVAASAANFGPSVDPYPPPVLVQPESAVVDFVGVGPVASNEFYERGPMDHLKLVEELRINQDLTVRPEELTNGSSNNNNNNNVTRFYVVDRRSQLMFTADAEAFSGCDRSFHVRIRDSAGRDVIVLRRPFRCCGCCLPCLCLQQMTVESPPGWHMGCVEENWNVLAPSFTVRDYQDVAIFTIVTRCCLSGSIMLCSGQDISYYVYDTRTAQQVGWISMSWNGNGPAVSANLDDGQRFAVSASSGFGRQQLTVSFLVQLPVQHKALLLSLALLLEFMLCERSHMRRGPNVRY